MTCKKCASIILEHVLLDDVSPVRYQVKAHTSDTLPWPLGTPSFPVYAVWTFDDYEKALDKYTELRIAEHRAADDAEQD